MFRIPVGLRLGGLLAGLFCALAAAAPAQDFAAPTGEVILTITGAIGATNAPGALHLDQAQFAALPQHSITTSTIWTEDTPTFEGVLLKDLIAAAQAKGGTLHLTALNDYQISMPVADAKDDGPLLAYLMNGEPMSVRDKGPVWLVFPYDQNADYRTEQTYARSIWQLDRIDFSD